MEDEKIVISRACPIRCPGNLPEDKPISSNAGLSLFVEIYNIGYHQGHHDTVEGQYTDVLPVDMNTYHDDLVEDILSDIKKR